MDNLNRTTSQANHTPTPTTKQAKFAIGDVVLCPSLSISPFTLAADPYGKRSELTLTHDGSYYYYDAQGYSVSFKDTETNRYQTSLFHNTPANRQAINTLYGNARPAQTNPLKIIDCTALGEDEAVLIPSMSLSDIACDIEGAAIALDDVGRLLGLIYRGEVDHSTAMALARLAHDSTITWGDLLSHQLEAINEPLSQSAFGKVGA